MLRFWLPPLLILLIGAFAAATAYVAPPLPASTPSAATQNSPVPSVLHFTTHRLSLEAARPGEDLTGELLLSNPTAAPISFRLTTTCGCSGVTPGEGTVAAGDSFTIQVSMHAPSVRGARQAAAVLLLDPAGQETDQCTVEALYPALIELTPATVALRLKETNQPLTSKVRLAPVGPAGLAALKLAQVRARHGHVRNPVLIENSPEEWELSFEVAATPTAALSDTVEIATPEEVIATLPVTVRVEQPVVLIPSRVAPRSTQTGFEIEILVRYSDSVQSGGFAIAEFPAVRPQEDRALSPQLRRLRFTLPELPPSGELQLSLGPSDQSQMLSLLPATTTKEMP